MLRTFRPFSFCIVVLTIAVLGASCGRTIPRARPDPSCQDGLKNGAETAIDCGGNCDPCPTGATCERWSDCESGLCQQGTCESEATASCSDGVKNGAETDVDCGGFGCLPCGATKACTSGADCESTLCEAGACVAPASTCMDGVRDGDETDADCGGSCGPCATGAECNTWKDCASGSCVSGRCTAPPMPCADGVRDGTETDVDCGGSCPACAFGQHCAMGSDCVTQFCADKTCVAPPASCTDGTKDGTETDVDCGGPNCGVCATGKTCKSAKDCLSGSCLNGVCAPPPPTCTDGAKNGSETDVDCGGPTCAACATGKACGSGNDCVSKNCLNGFCAPPPPSCTDGVKNGSETDVDCGGPTCAACATGKACATGADCTSASCLNGLCMPAPTCTDGVKNGSETDVDCGGPTCAACATGKACTSGNDCASKSCMNGLCAPPPPTCTDGVKNGSETDVDCGGPTCGACALGKSCFGNGDCASGACTNGVCTLPGPTCSDGIKNGNETDVDCGGGTCGACVAGRVCKVGTDCVGNVCSPAVVWTESSWKQTTAMPGSNWWLASYNDSTWQPSVEEAPYGQPPWGVGAPMPSGTPAKWIWNFDSRTANIGGTVWFRRVFTAPNATSLTLSITADDEYDVYVDGVWFGTNSWWYSTKTFTVSTTPYQQHLIAVEARNTGGGSPNPAAGGLIVDVRGSSTWCR